MNGDLLAKIEAIADSIRPAQPLDNPSSNDEPDSDAIKMFVGQIPRSWDEQMLTEFFEEFGPVYQINVLRNKDTNQSRGCCFVTFYARRSALAAQNALHNIKTLPGMYHPIQMKPANRETANEKKKLFIGMLSKKLNEDDLRDMFSSFGAIDSCSIIKDSNGQSKGCAFLTFSSRQNAVEAIKGMNHSMTMEGCHSPLVVKFADTSKEKDMRKQQHMIMNFLNMSKTANFVSGSTKYLPTTLPGLFPTTTLVNNPYVLSLQSPSTTSSAKALSLPLNNLYLPSVNTLANPSVTFGLGLPNKENILASTSTNNLQNLAALANLTGNSELSSFVLQNFSALAAASAVQTNSSPPQYFTRPDPNVTSSMSGPSSNSVTTMALPQNSSMISNNSTSINATNSPFSGLNKLSDMYSLEYLTNLLRQCENVNSKQNEGPEGANLFIYHLPPMYTDFDLAQAFMPFGNVISAKVFIDKETHLSKCFGFVSYDDPSSALTAIKAMNGVQIGSKRLKVQLKQPKDANKPYSKY